VEIPRADAERLPYRRRRRGGVVSGGRRQGRAVVSESLMPGRVRAVRLSGPVRGRWQDREEVTVVSLRGPEWGVMLSSFS